MKAHSSSSRVAGWPVLAAYFAAFVLTLMVGAVLVFGVAFARAAGHPARIAEEATHFALSPPGLIAVAFVDGAVLLGVALAMTRWSGQDAIAALALGPTRASALGFVATLVGVVSLSFACGAAVDLLGVRGGGVMDILAEQLRSLPAWLLLLAIGGIGIAPGVAEETFFRGFMQTRLTASWGRWPAMLVTSAAFAVIHLDRVQSTVAFVVGLFLGWTADRFRGIRPTIFGHALNNGLFVVLASFASGGVASRRTGILTLVAGAIVWIASVVVLRSAASERRGSVSAEGASAAGEE